MAYTEYYECLMKKFNQTDPEIDITGYNQQIINIPFHSCHYYELPGMDKEIIPLELSRSHQEEEQKIRYTDPELNALFDLPDTSIAENNDFSYILIRSAGRVKSSGLILMLHGLNEKKWEKYLTWACTLQKLTGKAVILFPITFHMNRAPGAWSNSRLMNRVAEERKRHFNGLSQSSFANAAISTRLYSRPQRFFFSGFQTYYDIVRLIMEIKAGENTFLDKNTSIDLFGYSIGAFLSEILFIAGHDNLFSGSRLALFCGGCTTDGFTPVSKTIMDSAAHSSFRNFYALNFEKEAAKNLIMNEFYKEPLPEALAFKCMLNYHLLRPFRESILRKNQDKIFAMPLKKDMVIPCSEVIKTLRGEDGSIKSRVEVCDLPYSYSHEVPFPIDRKERNMVDESFEMLFEKFALFLK